MAGYLIRRNYEQKRRQKMKLYIHWLEMSGLINKDDVTFITDSLNIPESLLKTFKTRKGTTVYAFETTGESESLCINIPKDGTGELSCGEDSSIASQTSQ